MHLSIFISIWQDELGEDLKLKVTQLEANNVQLEAKVEEQEKILNFLLNAAELPISAGDSELFPNIRQNVILSNLGKMSAIPRTCRELKAMNPSLASGMQWIDPDGQWIGDDPIYVYCDTSSYKIIKFIKNFFFQWKKFQSISAKRIHFHLTRQWVSHRRGPLRWSWMLFAIN